MRAEPRVNVARLRISIDGIEPQIWREVVVPTKSTLHALHRAIQILYGWLDYHLYELEFRGQRFQFPDDESDAEDSTKAKLSQFGLSPGDRLTYRYDFGDDWELLIDILELVNGADPAWMPFLVDGERSGPPEDCGGVHGYERLTRALRISFEDLDGDDRDFVEWAGDFNPDEFGVRQARQSLLLISAWGALKRR